MRVRKRTRTRQTRAEDASSSTPSRRTRGREGSQGPAEQQPGDREGSGRRDGGGTQDDNRGTGTSSGKASSGKASSGKASSGKASGKQKAQGGRSGDAKGRNRSQQRNRRNRGQRPKQPKDGTRFWGEADRLPPARTDVRLTNDPAAVPRSLGPPPLPGHESIAEHYFGVVYDRAVMTASALAAAGGLVDPDALTGEPGAAPDDE